MFTSYMNTLRPKFQMPKPNFIQFGHMIYSVYITMFEKQRHIKIKRIDLSAFLFLQLVFELYKLIFKISYIGVIRLVAIYETAYEILWVRKFMKTQIF